MTGQWQPRLGAWAGERVEGLAELEQQVAIAVWTPLGSIEGQPEFGSLVYTAIGETVLDARAIVTREVRRVLARWVRRAELVGVTCDVASEGALDVTVRWRPLERGAEVRELRRVITAIVPTPAPVAPFWIAAPRILGSLTIGSVLTCFIEPGAYSGTDPILLAVQWLRDGTPIAGATTLFYELEAADAGAELTVDVTASSSAGDATASSAAVSIPPVPPSFLTDPVISGTSELGETLTCDPGTWSGTEPITVAYQWRRDDVAISGATSATYDLVIDDTLVSRTIDCRVTLSNGSGTDEAASNKLDTVPSVPSFLTDPVISGTPELGETLTCDPGTWSGAEPITVAYEWRRDGVAISGATSATYDLVSADTAGTHAITCRVTLTNTSGSDQAVSNELDTVSSAFAPSFLTSPVISGTPEFGETLTCDPGTWVGTEPITVTYEWRRDGVAISGATSSTYTLVAADATYPEPITCHVTLTNGSGSDDALSNELDTVASPRAIFAGALMSFHRGDLLVTTASGRVSSWGDSSGNGRTFSQGTAGERPLPSTMGSQAALRFDGSRPDTLSLSGTGYGSPAAVHVIRVMVKDADPAASASTGGLDDFGTFAAKTYVPFTDGNVYDSTGLTATRYTVGNPTGSLAVPCVYESISTALKFESRLNGTVLYTGAYGGVGIPATPVIGGAPGTTYMSGYLGEHIVLSAEASAPQRAAYAAYVLARYGISIT